MRRTGTVCRPGDAVIIPWAGGTTTQLAIYPPQSSYRDLTFGWRVSIATIIAGTSEFTPLSGVDRILMMLEGHMVLEHQGHYQTALSPFDQDAFSGSWRTKSFGEGVDLNLMLQSPYVGEMKRRTVSELAARLADPWQEEMPQWQMFYVWNAALEFVVQGACQVVKPRELIVFHHDDPKSPIEYGVRPLQEAHWDDVTVIEILIREKYHQL